MGRRITYLLSRYPAVSHTFFLTEIRALRRQGFAVDVISINDCDRPAEQLTRAEREEQQAAFYLKSAGAAAILAALWRALSSAPLRFLRAAGYAARLSR
ncbi:MAG TPA: colanic acid biosynthesis glycosyltransferase WcaL, partial [Gammaproteobacteria bacterium]|nr:colanic acid biosynthesis glycosyltransferase WcaL [Gammaproteobacteria bacterium]